MTKSINLMFKQKYPLIMVSFFDWCIILRCQFLPISVPLIGIRIFLPLLYPLALCFIVFLWCYEPVYPLPRIAYIFVLIDTSKSRQWGQRFCLPSLLDYFIISVSISTKPYLIIWVEY